jgi:hypothetical protein
MEFELAEPVPAEQLAARIAAQAPPGLVVERVQLLGPRDGKARVEWAWYELPIPAPRCADLQSRISQLSQQSSYWMEREGRSTPVDLRAALGSLELTGGVLRFRLRVASPVSVRPREVLTALAVADLEQDGHHLTRTRVELAPDTA